MLNNDTTPTDLVGLHGLARALEPLRISLDWLRSEADSGRIPCLRIGRRLLFDVDAVRRCLLQRAGEFIEQEGT